MKRKVKEVTEDRKKLETAIPESRGYLVYDSSLCTGCHTCELICSAHHSNGKYQPSLSRIEVADDPFGGTVNSVEPKVCLQCEDPKCLTACEAGAIYVDEKTGARVIDEEKCRQRCDGGQPCIDACAAYYQPPRIYFDPERKVAIKCDLCLGEPECVAWCSNGALKYVFLAELKEVGSYQQDFYEPYAKDFGPLHIPYQGSTQTFEKIYPDKEI